MAKLTPLTLDEAQALGSLFGLEITSVSAILGGSVNSNFRLDLEGGGCVFLRIFEEQKAEGALREVTLLELLSRRGVSTPRPLTRTDGARLAEHKGKPVALYPWMEGDVICQRMVTADRARRVGEALARVHVAGASSDGAGPSRFDSAALRTRLEGLPWSSLAPDVRSAAEELIRNLREAPPRAPPSLGVIHGDLFRDNVLWRGDEISALLDFESASRGSAAFDLSVTLLAWCYSDTLDLELVRAMAGGYLSARELEIDERRHLFHEARFAAMRFAVTRITDYELRPGGSVAYRDFRRFLGRLRALDDLGAEGLSRLILSP